jgi:indolepyruvate ferredoxin oxidoreductase alpha subunit
LKPGGTIIMNTFKVVPAAVKVEDYPTLSDIKEMLKDYYLITIDANEIAASIGDKAGRSANAVVLGLLSSIEPFYAIPLETWVSALMAISRKDLEKSLNYKALKAGREYRKEK